MLPIGIAGSEEAEYEANNWTRILEKIVRSLPTHKLAMSAARSAAHGRLRHVRRFVAANEHERLKGSTGNENLRNSEDRKTAREIRSLCLGLAEHADAASSIMQKLLERDVRHKAQANGESSCCNNFCCSCCHTNVMNSTSETGTGEPDRMTSLRSSSGTTGPEIEEHERRHLFRLKEEKSFEKKLREEVLPRLQLLQEAEEDEAGKYLAGQTLCCCIPMYSVFRCAVIGDRYDINDRLRRRKKWCIYLMMSVYAAACALYVVLFGFCHGQEVTLAWMHSLFLQLAFSAMLVRPTSIFIMSSILPTVTIETGLNVMRKEKLRKRMSQREFEMGVLEKNPMHGDSNSENSCDSDWTLSDPEDTEDDCTNSFACISRKFSLGT